MVFQESPTATITAKIVGDNKVINIDGITTATTTPENAATQLNKILNIVGISVADRGMIRTRKEEAK